MNRSDLHPYQVRMVDFIKSRPSCALFAEMGTGKTISALTAISDLIDELEVRKVLIVAPLQVARVTWSDECAKWEHLQHLRVSRVLGDLKKRVAALKADADIYVIGRDSFVWLIKYYNSKIPYDMIVLDELTSFKSNTSQRFKAFRTIRTQPDRIIGLTGTPAPNGYLDLWAQIYCLDGGKRLGKFITHYRNMYFSQVMGPGMKYAVKCTLLPGAKQQIDDKISDISIAMKAEDYLTLPPRQDITKYIELPEDIMKRYRKFEHDMVLQISEEELITAANAAALLGKLLQLCNGAVYNDDKDYEVIHDEKISALLEIQEAANSPILVFYQYKHDLSRIERAFGKDVRVRPYSGEQDLRDWNAGKIDVLLAHPASCSYGLNLQEGGHICVWFGTGFNLETYQQACARLHRQGQQHRVMNYHLICRGTVDERALLALSQKADTQQSLMDAVKQLMEKYL